MNLVYCHSLSILEQLQLEEALLRNDTQNWCLINEGTSPAIVMGISGKPAELINQDKLHKEPIPLIKRFSGGGTVYVDHNTLFVTFIGNQELLQAPLFPKQILCWSRDLYHSLFPTNDFSIKENDYVIGNKKFGGNAQCITKKRWLHHSSLLWDFDKEKMEYLLLPKRTPAYRKKRTHSDFLCSLKEFFPSKKQWQYTFLDHLKQKHTLTEVSLAEASAHKTKPHRKATKVISCPQG